MPDDTQKKRTYLNLRDEKVIAEDFYSGNTNKKELAVKYNVSTQIIRSVTSQIEKLINLDPDASLLDRFYVPNQKCNKYTGIDTFIVEYIDIIRSKGGNINRSNITSLGKRYNQENNTTFAITDYFVSQFLKRNKLPYLALHEKSKNVALDDMQEFKARYKLMANDYDEKNIFNIDETGLFVKNIGNKTYVLSKKDNKGTKKLNSELLLCSV